MDFTDGKLELVYGTMFSGKTTHLLTKMSMFSDLGFNILYINIEFDTRSVNNYSTHNYFLNSKKNIENNKQKNINMIKTKNLQNIDFDKYDIILIDEAHFFDDIVNIVHMLLDKKKYIIISSLIADFEGKKFGNVNELIPICDEIHRLHAYCAICAKEKKCRNAIYSKRINNNKNTIEIGGVEKYIPVCRTHF